MKSSFAVVVAGAWMLAAPCLGQDLAKAAGSAAKVILDNDKVRVIELTIPPGGSTGMHSHADSFVYFLTASDATQKDASGKIQLRHFKPGDVIWSPPGAHDTINQGAQPTRTLIVELKPQK